MVRSKLGKIRTRLTMPLVFLALLGAIWFNQNQGLAAKSNEICETLNTANATLSDYILDQIARSEKSLPTLDYYKEHPDELSDVLNNLRKQKADTISAFKPADC